MRLKFKLSLTAILILGFAILAPKFSSVWASKLILNPPFSNVEEGKDLEVEIVLQSDGERVDGVDVSLMYDAGYLELKELREGGFFGTYPIKQDESGKLKLTSGIGSEIVKKGSGTLIPDSIKYFVKFLSTVILRRYEE